MADSRTLAAVPGLPAAGFTSLAASPSLAANADASDPLPENDPLPAGVSQVTPLSVAQAVTEGPRFAVESVLEPVTMTITRIKRMRSIDEQGVCLEEGAGNSVRRNWSVAESRRDWLQQASLLTLNIRLQV